MKIVDSYELLNAMLVENCVHDGICDIIGLLIIGTNDIGVIQK